MKTGLVLVQIKDGFIYFNRQFTIPLSFSNFPPTDYAFRSNTSKLWLAEMASFDKTNKHLTLKVLDLDSNQWDVFANQVPKQIISKVIFTDIPWEGLTSQLSFYKKSDFMHLISPTSDVPKSADHLSKYLPKTLANKSEILIENRKISWADLTFGIGKVSFEVFLEGYSSRFQVDITNPHILPGFKYLLPYLIKKMGRQIEVVLKVEVVSGKVIRITATSPDINKINEKLITTLKYYHVDQFVHRTDIDKSLFTTEDIFESLTDKSEDVHPLHTHDTDLIALLLDSKEIRNAQQINFLCTEIHSKSQKILFTLQPKFGFVFYKLTSNCHHFIWELLESNATYVWSFYRSVISKNEALTFIGQYITIIKNSGRLSFRSNWMLNRLHPDHQFHVINHLHAESKLIDGFPWWRSSLIELLA